MFEWVGFQNAILNLFHFFRLRAVADNSIFSAPASIIKFIWYIAQYPVRGGVRTGATGAIAPVEFDNSYSARK